jgi:hypothetical protein
MATTDTRSGFRLPWSSDRNQDAAAADEAAPTADEAIESATSDAEPGVRSDWPADSTNDRGEPAAGTGESDPSDVIAPNAAQEPAMIALDQSPAAATPAAPRKPSKLMVDLGAAIRATAEAARDQTLAQVDADVARVVEAIRSGAREGEDVLRVRSDEDVAQIKDWSRAEIARIKEETESRIAARKLGLDEELVTHAAAIEQRVGQVEGTAATYRDSMHAYADGLANEDDPSRLATLAESMPEPPELEAWADLSSLELVLAPVEIAPDHHLVPGREPGVPDVEAVAEPIETAAETYETDETDDAGEPAEIPFENIVAALGGDPGMSVAEPVADDDAQLPTDEVEAHTGDAKRVAAPSWGDSPELTMSGTRHLLIGEASDDAPAAGADAGDPIDRGAVLAALEAAAEAVVAAESAAVSANQAEAAADAAETAAELLKGRVDPGDGIDPAATAAMSARMDAGGFEESFADRLASLMPGRGEGAVDGEPRTTQIVVAGLVSVASIASFKRHLGRLSGVQGVAVSSGPDGEFVFNVTHRPDVSFRDAVPTMPGFAARVTNNADGVVHVTARDPEAEG